jgi:4'-phosphopantetheinyl transferase
VTDAIIYYRSLDGSLAAALRARWLVRLPYGKRREVERSSAGAASATLAGIDLLAHAARALGYPAFDAGQLEFPARGKPRWPGGPEFSISHAGGYVACAAARGARVGIDLEVRGRVRPEVLRRVASAAELARFGRHADGATRLWTRKEAVVKAEGGSVFEAAAVVVHEDSADFRGRRWYFAGPEQLAECALALAIEIPEALVELRPATHLA